MSKSSMPNRHSRYYADWEYKERRKRKKRREKMFLRIAIAVLCMIFAVCIAGLSLSVFRRDGLQGIWRYDETTSYQFDGKERGMLMVSDAQYSFRYFTGDGRLKLDFEDEKIGSAEYDFFIEEENLTLTVPATGQKFKLDREGSR